MLTHNWLDPRLFVAKSCLRGSPSHHSAALHCLGITLLERSHEPTCTIVASDKDFSGLAQCWRVHWIVQGPGGWSGVKGQVCQGLAVRPWASHLASLRLGACSWETEITWLTFEGFSVRSNVCKFLVQEHCSIYNNYYCCDNQEN